MFVPENQELKILLAHPIQLSIAVPAYNESECVYATVMRWYDFLTQNKNIAEFEIVICNDGSHDETALILDHLHAHYPQIRPFHFMKNQGASLALRKAIKETRFPWVLLLDADDQCPIENIDTLLATLRSTTAAAVIGIREKKGSLFARLGSKVSGALCNWVHGARLKDFNSACKLVYGPLLRSLVLEARGMNYSVEITSKLLERDMALKQVPIIHQSRIKGMSKMKWMQDSVHRFLFVLYIALRQLLFKLNVIKQS